MCVCVCVRVCVCVCVRVCVCVISDCCVQLQYVPMDVSHVDVSHVDARKHTHAHTHTTHACMPSYLIGQNEFHFTWLLVFSSTFKL